MNSKVNWVLKIDPDVYKDLAKFPKDYAKKILEIVENLPSDPYFGDIEKIKNEKYLWRRRIGSYRIFYELYPEKNLIHVLWAERRTSKTY